MAFRLRQRHNPVPSGRSAWHRIGGSYQSAMGHRRPHPGLPVTWPACRLQSIQVSVSHPIGFGVPLRVRLVHPVCNGLEPVGGEAKAAGLIDLPTWVVGWHFGPLCGASKFRQSSLTAMVPGGSFPIRSPFRFSLCSHLRCPGVFPRSPRVDGLSRRRIRATGLALPLNHTVGVPNDALWLLHLATAGCGRRWAS